MSETSSKISILGCGWLGLPLGEQLIDAGHIVNGSTRSLDKSMLLNSKGIHHHIVDIEENTPISPAFLEADTLIIAVTNKNVQAFESLVENIKNAPIEQVLFISSTSVYPMTNGLITEDSPVKECDLIRIENLLRNETGFKTTILRFAGLYGPNRDPGNFLKLDQKIKNPDAPINLIHQEDCIQLILRILNKILWDDVFNAATEEHPTRRYYYSRVTLSARGQKPEFDENGPKQFKVIDNTKVKNATQYEFRHSL